jgi:hypothetical protein
LITGKAAARHGSTSIAVVVERDRVVPVEDQLLVQDVEHLQERRVGRDVLDVVGDHLPGGGRGGLPPHPYLDVHYL